MSTTPSPAPPSSDRRIRLVVADVDGTLVTPEKVLTARARRAIEALHARGILFTITSGRPPLGMKALIDDLRLELPVAGFNGGAIVHPDLSVIRTRLLAADAARTVIDRLTKDGIDVWVYTAADWRLHTRTAPHVDREIRTVAFDPIVVTSFDDVLDRAIKIVGVSDDAGAMATCLSDIQQAVAGHVSAALSQPYYLDVTHPDANKGRFLAALTEVLGIPEAEMATLGDMPNDITMFRPSGLSIAMGQSAPEVQQAASVVTGSNRAEGFASAIERFVLK